MTKYQPPPTRFGGARPRAGASAAPPPTKFGVAPVQAKAGPVSRPAVPPPPTRFGPAPVQPKNAAAPRMSAVPPPPVRYGSAPAAVQRKAAPHARGVIQRAQEFNDLSEVSKSISALSGYNDLATFSMVLHQAPNNGNDYGLYAQRYYTSVDDNMGPILNTIGLPLDTGYTTPDYQDQGNIHAEMLAVSEWLRGNTSKPWTVGASRVVCLYCWRVLAHLDINIESEVSHEPTKNWVSPWYNVGQANPPTLNIPRYRTNNHNY